MDYAKAREELADSGKLGSTDLRNAAVARIAAEATVDIAESLRLFLDSGDSYVSTPEPVEIEPQSEAHDFIVGDAVALIGAPRVETYFIDDIRSDQGGTAVRLTEHEADIPFEGWIYTSSLIFVDHPRDPEPGWPQDAEDLYAGTTMSGVTIIADAELEDADGDWHEEPPASGISVLKAKADKKAKGKK